MGHCVASVDRRTRARLAHRSGRRTREVPPCDDQGGSLRQFADTGSVPAIPPHTRTQQCRTKRLNQSMQMPMRPVIAMTMGDAAGIGPEVIMKALAHDDIYDQCAPLVIGDALRLQKAGRIVGEELVVRSLTPDQIDEALYTKDTVDCIDLKLIPSDLPWGKLSAIAGDAAFRYIEIAAKLAISGKIQAICTAPLNKEALHAGGHKFPGHTEMLATLTGVKEVSMMLVAPQLRVIHVTTHIGIIDAIRKIEPGLVQRTIERGNATLVKAGIEKPRIGVCGINPHAGENGLFGYGEEEEKIIPAVKLLQERGLDITG